jgi:hypothetical protein
VRARRAALSSDRRLTYWLKGRSALNFGDFLSELLLAAIGQKIWHEPAAGQPRGDYDVIHLLGSVISTPHIQRGLEHARWPAGRNIVFWGCGKRDAAPIESELLSHCDFRGVRGPLTRDALELPADTVLGDPGLLLPLLHQPAAMPDIAGKTICVPHFLDTLSDRELLQRTGADQVMRPVLRPDMAELRRFIDIIAGARFILAGALHAAITACAFGTPFSYFDSGYVDVPFKWDDFARSIGIPVVFAHSVVEGLSLHASELKPRIAVPPLAPILANAPFQPPRLLIRRAISFDLEKAAAF